MSVSRMNPGMSLHRGRAVRVTALFLITGVCLTAGVALSPMSFLSEAVTPLLVPGSVASAPTTTTVGFHDTGLSGQYWSVKLGATVMSTDPQVGWTGSEQPNGTYTYHQSRPAGLTPKSSSGTVARPTSAPASRLADSKSIVPPRSSGRQSIFPGAMNRRRSTEPPLDPSAERVVDYRNYNFRAVWFGRAAVDRFDRALLDLALQEMDGRRTLEIGTGFGRLSPQILRGGGEYVGTDFDLGGLRDTRASTVGLALQNPHSTWLAANVYHLPFATGSFSSVNLVRVHHHLADPGAAMKEIARVLAPGGTALITYSPRSGLRSFVHDVRVVFGRPKVANDRFLLFARGDHILVRDRPLNRYITGQRRFQRDLNEAGLKAVRSYGGVETLAARLFPLTFALAGSQAWPAAPVFSDRWVVARKEGGPSELPPWREILACPRCGGPGPSLIDSATPASGCARCAFVFRWEGDLLDARYIPGRIPEDPVPVGRPLSVTSVSIDPPRP
jgi:SAM-dependent methyltransferase